MCAEIKLRAERRAGEVLREMPKATGGQPYQEKNSTPYIMKGVEINEPPTLADVGISYAQSSRYQSIAALPDEVFEQEIAETKNNCDELTSVV